MNSSTLRLIWLAILILEQFVGMVASNSVPAESEKVENKPDRTWDMLGLGKMSKQSFIITCVVIAAAIFLIVVIFAVFIFVVEAHEYKVEGKKTSKEFRKYCHDIEMERQASGPEKKKREERETKKRYGFIALDISDSDSSSSVKSDGGPSRCSLSLRRSMDEMSFKTIPEEEESQMEDFCSLH